MNLKCSPASQISQWFSYCNELPWIAIERFDKSKNIPIGTVSLSRSLAIMLVIFNVAISVEYPFRDPYLCLYKKNSLFFLMKTAFAIILRWQEETIFVRNF